MKLTVEGFKSIKKVKEFEFLPMTLLAGINSSGKSSLIQVLLLLKQTLKTKDVLSINGPYVYAEALKDLMYGKKSGELILEISDTADKMTNSAKRRFSNLLGKQGQVKSMQVRFVFKVNGNIKLSNLLLHIDGMHEESYHWSLDYLPGHNGMYKFYAVQNPLIGEQQIRDWEKCQPRFENFIPLYIEDHGHVDASTMEIRSFRSNASDTLLSYIEEYVNSLYYIKALRVEPDLKKSYKSTVNRAYIDPDGQNLQFVYNEKRDEKVREDETLSQALIRWLGRGLNLSHNFEVQQDEEKFYHTLLRMQKGLDVDLCQVGFGVSQVLPILVQGLLTPKGGTLIVEDPEVHMHPSVQAGLVDFFMEMIQDGKRVIIETHSDHIVTRLRRRIAEKQLDPKLINLCFVTMIPEQGSLYQTINVMEQGNLEAPLPEGFLDVQDDDFRAILRARIGQ